MEDKRITGETPLDKVMRKVQLALNIALDPNTPPDEARVAQAKADALMHEYDIKFITEQFAKPASERIKPKIVTVEVGPTGDLSGYFDWMAEIVAEHCHCKYKGWTAWTNNGWQGKVYGFEADTEYFLNLYSRIRLHMINLFVPHIDPNETLEQNSYRLHIGGQNWLQIAALYGWRKLSLVEAAAEGFPGKGEFWKNKHSGEVYSATKVGGIYKRAYLRAATAKGEAHVKIAAGGTDGYRKDAANGYVNQIDRRLDQIRSGRQAGAELVLGQAFKDVEDLFREDNPELFRPAPPPDPNAKPAKAVKLRRAPVRKFNDQAYRIGVGRANTANLNPGMSGAPKREIS